MQTSRSGCATTRPEIRQRVNRQLVQGYSLSAILANLSAINSGLPANRRVTRDSLQTHRTRHLDLQVGASSVWRRMLEDRVAADADDYAAGVVSLITPRAYLEVLLAKSYTNLVEESAEVGCGRGPKRGQGVDQVGRPGGRRAGVGEGARAAGPDFRRVPRPASGVSADGDGPDRWADAAPARRRASGTGRRHCHVDCKM